MGALSSEVSYIGTREVSSYSVTEQSLEIGYQKKVCEAALSSHEQFMKIECCLLTVPTTGELNPSVLNRNLGGM